jgi:hypothetical protein
MALREMQSMNTELNESVASLKQALEKKILESDAEKEKLSALQNELHQRMSEREERNKQELEKMSLSMTAIQHENDGLRRQHSDTNASFMSTLSTMQSLNESLKEQLRVAEKRLVATQGAFETVAKDLKVANNKVAEMTTFSADLKSECAEKIKALTAVVKKQQEIIKKKAIHTAVDEKLSYLEKVLVEKVEMLRACEEREKMHLKRIQSLEESDRHLFHSLEKERGLREKEREMAEKGHGERERGKENLKSKEKDTTVSEARILELSLALKVKEVMLNDQAAIIINLRNKLTAKEKDLANARDWVSELEDRLRQGGEEVKDLEIELAGKQAIENELKDLLAEMSAHYKSSNVVNTLLISHSQSIQSPSILEQNKFITTLEE